MTHLALASHGDEISTSEDCDMCATVSLHPRLPVRVVESLEQKQRLRGRDGDNAEAHTAGAVPCSGRGRAHSRHQSFHFVNSQGASATTAGTPRGSRGQPTPAVRVWPFFPTLGLCDAKVWCWCVRWRCGHRDQLKLGPT